MQHSYLADIDSIVFGLQKLWCISREMVSVHELLTTGFVQPLENKIDMIQRVKHKFYIFNHMALLNIFNIVDTYYGHQNNSMHLSLTSLSCFAFSLACSMTGVSRTLVNLIVSGCCLYFFSLRAAPATFAFSTSREPMGIQPVPFT